MERGRCRGLVHIVKFWSSLTTARSYVDSRINVAVAHIIRRGLVILLIKELMKYLFSIFVFYLFVYFSTLACLKYFTPRVSPAH